MGLFLSKALSFAIQFLNTFVFSLRRCFANFLPLIFPITTNLPVEPLHNDRRSSGMQTGSQTGWVSLVLHLNCKCILEHTPKHSLLCLCTIRTVVQGHLSADTAQEFSVTSFENRLAQKNQNCINIPSQTCCSKDGHYLSSH